MLGKINNSTRQCLEALGVNTDDIARRKLRFYANAENLVIADVSQSGHKHRLHPVAATKWQHLKQAAADDQISLILISAYRSFERQHELIEARVNSGENAHTVLSRLAPPGYSQHHTGCAVDIGTLGCAPAVEAFEHTAAFKWLEKHAAKYGFTMSYPRDNLEGFDYEPWHWYFDDDQTYCTKRS